MVEDVGHGIRVEFAGTWVGLEPGADDLVADEVATLAGFTDGSTQIWRPGEGIFAGWAGRTSGSTRPGAG